MRKRVLYGLNEVRKALKIGKVKCLIVAPNVENLGAGNGPQDLLGGIIQTAKEKDLELVYALTRSKLGKAIRNHVRISVVAILDYNGADDLYREVLREAEKGRAAYRAQAVGGRGA